MLAQYTEENGIGLGKIFDKVKINAEDYSDVIEKIAKTSLGDVLDGDRLSVEKLSNAIGSSDSVILGYAETLKDTEGNIDLTTASTEGLSAYLEKSGNMFDFAAIKATLLNTALNAGIFLVASVAIQGIAKALDNYIHRVEKARERTDKLFDEFKQMNDTLADHKKTVSELADRYDELSKGVNLSTNDNVSLSTEEYEEFLGINEQLSQSFPELAKGIDENGNSILTLGTKGITAKEQLEELIQTEEDLNNFRIAQGLEDTFKGVYTYVEDANKATGKLNGTISDSSEAMSKLQDIAENGIKLTGENGQLIFAGNTNNQAELDYMNSLTTSVNEFWKSLDSSRRVELGINPSDLFTQNFNEYTGAFEVYANLYQLTPEEITALENIIQDNVGDASGALLDSISDQSQELQEQIQKGKNAWTDFVPALVAGMQSKQTFKNLDSDLQNIAIQIVEGLDYSYADAMNAWDPDPYAYVRDKIIDPLSKLDDSGKQKLQSSFEELFKLDADDLSQSNQTTIENLITTIATLLEKDSLEIRVALGFDVEEVQDRYNNALKEAKRQLGGFGHDDKGFEANNSIGDKLDDFWDKNVVTEEDWVLWKNVTDGIADATEAMNAYTEAKKGAASQEIDLTPSINMNGIVSGIEKKVKPVMDAIQSAWADAYDDEGVFKIDPSKALDAVNQVKSAIDSINSEEGLGIQIDTSSIEELANVLTDTSATEEEVRQAYANIADAVMNEFLPAMDGMDDAHIRVMQTFLEGLGIMNAEELIIQQLGYTYETYTAAKQVAAQAGIDLANATVEDVMKFAEEFTAAEEDKIALLDYYQYKIIASGATIDTSGSIAQLLAEYEQLGINCEKLKEYLGLHGAGAGSKVDLKHKGYSSSTEGYNTGANTKPKLPEIPKGIDDRRAKAAKSASKAAKEEADVMSELNSEMDKLQSAYKSLCDIKDTYNKYGKITVDQYQELTNMGFNFLANLVDENGQLGLNASAFERLAQAKLEEMQIQMARNATDTINGLKTEAEAVEYLTYANEKLRDAALGAAEAQLESAVAAAKMRGEQQGAAAEQIYKGYQASKQMAGRVDFFFDPSALEKEEKEKQKAEKEDKTDKLLEAYNKEKAVLEHMLAMDQISKSEYYERLMALVKQYFEGDEEHQDQIWDVEEGYHDYLESIKETYNWIEIFLDNLAKKANALIDKASKFISWSKKNAMINRAVKATDKQITGQTNAYAYYAEKARKVGLNNAYIDKIQNGTLTMEDMQNEALSGKIEKYQEWLIV